MQARIVQAAKLIPSPKTFITIAGPSGSGKSTIISKLISEYPNTFGLCASHTTRNKRIGEQEGVHYHFTSHEWMKSAIEQGAFLEHTEAHGHLYGTSYEAMLSILNTGKICILDLDLRGCMSIKNNASIAPLSKFLFIRPPSLQFLEQRLRNRGTESDEVIQRRLQAAEKELEFVEKNPKFFEHVIEHTEISNTFPILKKILQDNSITLK